VHQQKNNDLVQLHHFYWETQKLKI
jgi:hypothetical protein